MTVCAWCLSVGRHLLSESFTSFKTGGVELFELSTSYRCGMRLE